jgi:thioredoxin-dependent peroxiredoxin
MVDMLGLNGQDRLSTTLGVGDFAPEFMLRDQDNNRVRLADLTRQGIVVLYFYPRDYSLGCTLEACAFRDAYEAFTTEGAIVVGVSNDSTDLHRDFIKKYDLPFTLLSDEDKAVHEHYGVRKTLGLIGGRVTFVIDQQGVIRHIFSSYLNFRKHISESLRIIEQIREGE